MKYDTTASPTREVVTHIRWLLRKDGTKTLQVPVKTVNIDRYGYICSDIEWVDVEVVEEEQ